jgi:nicotinamidase-related amidase
MNRHPQILNRHSCALLIVDVQQKINAVMMHREQVVDNIIKLVKACHILKVPIFITEQYPQGLGPIEPAILQALEHQAPAQKMTFSCCGAPAVMAELANHGIQQVIVTGIECHVCVQQTGLDLLAHGFQVHLPKDAVSSRKAIDYETAIERMARAGVIITTIESSMFELLVQAGTPEFKQVAKLIK